MMENISGTSRLFIALEIPDKLKSALLRKPFSLPRSRLTPREQLHLTLRFLGKTSAKQTQRLSEYIQHELAFLKPIPLVPEGIGFFPNLRRASSMHLRLELTPELRELKKRLDSDLLCLNGTPKESDFIAHVTLMRLKSPLTDIDRKHLAVWENELEIPETRAVCLTLFLSRQEDGRLLHIPLASCSCR